MFTLFSVDIYCRISDNYIDTNFVSIWYYFNEKFKFHPEYLKITLNKLFFSTVIVRIIILKNVLCEKYRSIHKLIQKSLQIFTTHQNPQRKRSYTSFTRVVPS